MNVIDFPIERINDFLEEHIFEVKTQPLHDESYILKTNVKVILTGIKDYYSVGKKLPYIEYTLYILEGDDESNKWYSMFSRVYGSEVPITTSDNYYYELRHSLSNMLHNFLKYFGVDMDVICTKVINEINPMKLDEH